MYVHALLEQRTAAPWQNTWNAQIMVPLMHDPIIGPLVPPWFYAFLVSVVDLFSAIVDS
jgi:hypothetical protein